MLTIKRILAPTDLSPFAAVGLRAAADLARKLGSKLMILHVLPDEELTALAKGHVPPRPVDLIYEDKEFEVREYFKTEVPEVLRRGVQVEVMIVPGVPFLEVVRTARHREADMVVMATHGRTGLKHAFLGSVTEKVLRKAPCPVLSIRPEGHEFVLP